MTKMMMMMMLLMRKELLSLVPPGYQEVHPSKCLSLKISIHIFYFEDSTVIEIFFEIKEPLAISFSWTPAMVGY